MKEDDFLLSSSSPQQNSFPIDIYINHIDVFVKKSHKVSQFYKEKEYIHILRDIRGIVKPGEMVAIMGSSGSGKTTLLNTLAGRFPDGKISYSRWTQEDFHSSFYFDPSTSVALDIDDIRDHVGYVMQSDQLIPHLTCYEMLYYSGMLRLPRSLSKREKRREIQRVIRELGLTDCAQTRIGSTDGSGQRLSGGERRRLSIAIQLLTQPSVLYLDEPTSGLDAFTANRLITTLVSIAHDQNRIVICTIHQPRTEVLNLFDKSLLLSNGKIVYWGPSMEMVPYFATLNFVVPEHVNPADYLLDQISIDPRSEEVYEESKKRLDFLVSSFNQSRESLSITSRIQEFGKKSNHASSKQNKEVKGEKQEKANWLYQVWILSRRSYLNLFRNPVIVITRLMQVLSFGIILSLCYLRINNDQIGIQNMQGFLYECLAVLFVGQLNAVAIYPPARDLFYIEREDGSCGTFSFFLSYLVAELPFELLSVILYGIITCAIVGLKVTWEAYFVYIAALFFLTFSGESLGLILCSLFEGVGLANTLATIILSIGLLSSGSFVPIQDLPSIVRWIDYTLITTYCTQILCINQFVGETYTCPGSQALPNGECPYNTGNDVLDSMGINPDNLWPSFAMGLFLTCSYRFLAFLILYGKRKLQK